jgi:hypothetical protein
LVLVDGFKCSMWLLQVETAWQVRNRCMIVVWSGLSRHLGCATRRLVSLGYQVVVVGRLQC